MVMPARQLPQTELKHSSQFKDRRRGKSDENRTEMAAITAAVIAIAGVVLGWIAIEIACKPCLEKGREAIDRSLDPNYDPDDEIRTPLNPDPAAAAVAAAAANSKPTTDSGTSSDAIKTI